MSRTWLCILLALVAVPPVIVKTKCDDVDTAATCRRVCEVKLPGKQIFKSEVVGVAGDDEHYVCACYHERTIVVYDEMDATAPKPVKPEKESQ
jgi:hypothetical protein